MNFKFPLLQGQLIKRYKRFLVDIELEEGNIITAHCANSGSMQGLLVPGAPVWVTPFPSESQRTLKYSWEIVYVDDTFVGVNTSLPNNLIAEALDRKEIPFLSAFTSYKREVKYGEKSRVDFLLQDPQGGVCYLEVKNVHLKRGDYAQFPDSVTERGTKHLKDLIAVREMGHRAVMVYVIQRADCCAFSLAEDIDFLYSQTAQEALKRGVEFLAYDCEVTPLGINLRQPLKVLL
jgi:sugar fermentation stimulation protein A